LFERQAVRGSTRSRSTELHYSILLFGIVKTFSEEIQSIFSPTTTPKTPADERKPYFP